MSATTVTAYFIAGDIDEKCCRTEAEEQEAATGHRPALHFHRSTEPCNQRCEPESRT